MKRFALPFVLALLLVSSSLAQWCHKNGQVEVCKGATMTVAYYKKGKAIASVHDVVCKESERAVTDCGRNLDQAIAGISTTTGTKVVVISEGDVIVRLDNTATLKDKVCLSTTTNGQGHAIPPTEKCAPIPYLGRVEGVAGFLTVPEDSGMHTEAITPTTPLIHFCSCNCEKEKQ